MVVRGGVRSSVMTMIGAVRRFGMPFAIGLLLLAGLAGLPGPKAEPVLTGELALRAEIRQHVIDLFGNDDFDALEALAAGYRSEQSRTGSGVWKLSLFYGAIQEAGRLPASDTAGWSALGDRMRRWLALHPTSPTPYVANGIVMKRYAWSLQPRKILIEAAAKPEEAFVGAIEAAASFLDANRTIASADPHFYAVRAELASALAMPPAEFVELIEAGLTATPDYLPTMFVGMDYFAPERLPDGRAGDARSLEAYANMMRSRFTDDAGLAIYARLYWHAHGVVFGDKLFVESALDWRRMSAGMDAVLARYPDDWNINSFASIACLAGDRSKALALIDRIAAPIPQAWQKGMSFEACRAFVREAAVSANAD